MYIKEKKRSNGFTIIEILIFIFFVSIIAAISAVSIKALQPGIQLTGSVRNIVTDLRYAQQITVTGQEKHCLKIFPDDKKYQIKKCSGEDIILEKYLPIEISLFSSNGFTDNEVEFNPYGAVKESGTITLINNKDKSMVIEVRPSGFIKIQ